MSMMSINTERFTVRTLTAQDVTTDYLHWFSSPVTAKYISYRPETLSELINYVDTKFKQEDCLLLGVFHNDTHIGNIKYEPIDVAKGTAIFGILIGDEKWQGKGVASEVILAGNKLLCSLYSVGKIELGVDKQNLGALSVYKKMGFKVSQDFDTYLMMELCTDGL